MLASGCVGGIEIMLNIKVLDTGVVYRNPKPHLASRHAYFPTAVQLDNGEIVVAMDIGSAFEAVDVRSYTSRSADLGASWSEPQPIFEPDESVNLASSTCRISKLADGSLFGWAGVFQRPDPNCGLVNPTTDGFCDTVYGSVRSTNGGRSWSPLRRHDLPEGWQQFEVCAPAFPATAERLLVVTHAFPDWNGQVSPWGRTGIALASNDGGQNWEDTVKLFEDPQSKAAFFETSMTRLSDKRLLAVCWTMDLATGASLHNQVVTSDDGGLTFSGQQATPLHGETARPLGLPDGYLLIVYRRVDKKGLWAHLAKVSEHDWTAVDDKLLWGGDVASHRTDLGNSLGQLSTLRFGCPCVLQLQNGDVFVVFWGVEDCSSVIRWFRLGIL
jgi:hypothetical protein